MTLEDLYPLARSAYVVWFVLLFLGIVAWAFWPSRRARLERYGALPLRED